MDNDQIDRSNENPIIHLLDDWDKPRKRTQSGWSVPGFELGTSRIWVHCVITDPPRSFAFYFLYNKNFRRLRWSSVYQLASGSEVRGFDPSRSRWIFQSVKILSIPSFGREVKPWVPCRRFSLRHAKEAQAEIRASEQNVSDLSPSMSEATLMT